MAKRRRASRGAMKAKQPIKKARRTSRRRSSKGNKRGHKGVSLAQARHHLDPLGKTMPLPVPGQTASFVTQNGILRQDIDVNTEDAYLLFTWMPGAQKFVGWYKEDRRALFPRASCYGAYNATQATGAQPVSLRQLRMAFRLRNISAAQHVAGTVRCLLAEDWPEIKLSLAMTHPLLGEIELGSPDDVRYD